MATVRLTPAGVYSVVDLEKVSAELTGNGIFQEFGLDKTEFANKLFENGQLAIIDNNKKTIKVPTAIGDKVYLHASVAKTYKEGAGRETYAVTAKDKTYLPRLFALVATDVIATNAVTFDTTDFADLNAAKVAIKAGTAVVVPQAGADWKLVKVAGATGASVIGDVEWTVLSNDREGVRIRIR
ncbi:MAG: hypothetical protein RSA51_07300 [Niameybacter sp.]